jgi:hypothetical protein
MVKDRPIPGLRWLAGAGNTTTTYATTRSRLDRFAKAWAAAVPAGLDPGPGMIARNALDRDRAFRAEAREYASPDFGHIVDALADGSMSLDDVVVVVSQASAIGGVREALVDRVGVRILREAVRELEALGDRLITDHIRPAHDAVVDELTRLVSKVDGVVDDPSAIRAGKPTAEAWRRATELEGWVGLLRHAAPGFLPSVDARRDLDEFRFWRDPMARPKPSAKNATRRLLDAIAAGAGPTFHTAGEVHDLTVAHDHAEREAVPV